MRARELDEALSRARGAISEPWRTMSYSGLLLEAEEQELVITGAGEGGSIISRVTARVDEPGSVLLVPKPLSDWLRAVEGDATIELRDADGHLIIDGDGAGYRFNTMVIAFEKMEGARGTAREARVSEMGAGLAAVRSSVGTNGLVQVVSTDEDVAVRTTDYYRLCQAVVRGAGWGEFSGSMPLAMLEHVDWSLVERVRVDQRGRVVDFEGPRVRYSVHLSPVPFPNVDEQLAKEPVERIEVGLSDLNAALGRLRALADGNSITCSVADGRMRLEASSVLGRGVEDIEALGASDGVRFSVILDYLRASLHKRAGETVTIGWRAPMAPLMILSSDPLPITTLVMPVHLADDGS